jgi:hypothetical protein
MILGKKKANKYGAESRKALHTKFLENSKKKDKFKN